MSSTPASAFFFTAFVATLAYELHQWRYNGVPELPHNDPSPYQFNDSHRFNGTTPLYPEMPRVNSGFDWRDEPVSYGGR